MLFYRAVFHASFFKKFFTNSPLTIKFTKEGLIVNGSEIPATVDKFYKVFTLNIENLEKIKEVLMKSNNNYVLLDLRKIGNDLILEINNTKIEL
jgi:hypothetical protein